MDTAWLQSISILMIMTTRWETPDPALVGLVQQLPIGRALDVGCGGGHDTVWLAGQGWSVVAVDTSKHAIAALRKTVTRDSLNATARMEDVTTMAFDSEFDLVSICYMHLLPRDRELMLNRSISATKPGGTLLFRSFESGIEDPPFDRDLLPSIDDVVDSLSSRMDVTISRVEDEFFPYMKKEMRLLTVVAVRKKTTD